MYEQFYSDGFDWKSLNDPLPQMSKQERADLEYESGHAFASNEEAHRYRIRKLNVVTSSADLRERIERSRV